MRETTGEGRHRLQRSKRHETLTALAAERPSPAEVFTPRSYPTREMFTQRRGRAHGYTVELDALLLEAIRQPGAQLLIYGDTGVGKSSLLKFVGEDAQLMSRVVECQAQMSFESHIDVALRDLIRHREVEITEERGSLSSKTVGLGARIVSLVGRRERTKKASHRSETVYQTPVLGLLDTLAQADEQLLVFENFQNVRSGERAKFAQMMEIVSDRTDRTGGIKVVLVGVAEDASTLLSASRSARRRIIEIGVPRMPRGEVRTIFERGFELLGLTCVPEALSSLVFYADGFPFFAHLLGLNCALSASNSTIGARTLGRALSRTSAEFDQSIAACIQRVRYGGNLQSRGRRTKILQALAASRRRSWRFRGILIESRGRTDVFETDLIQEVANELASQACGAPLICSGETEELHRYRFGEPYLRPYLRMNPIAEVRTTADWWRQPG